MVEITPRCKGIIYSWQYLSWASTCFPLGLDNKTIVGTTNPSRFSDSSNSVLWHLQSQNTADPKKSHSVPIRVWFSRSSANQPDKPCFLDATLIGCVWLAEPQVSDSYLHTCVCHCKKLSLHRYEQNDSLVPLIWEKTVTSQSRRSIWQTMMQAQVRHKLQTPLGEEIQQHHLP